MWEKTNVDIKNSSDTQLNKNRPCLLYTERINLNRKTDIFYNKAEIGI